MNTKRIIMWSGPRNISTTMMRSFENRSDCTVVDEPFYAHYLQESGADHPMREEILREQATDWRRVVELLFAPCDAPMQFQKHMTHHLTPSMDWDWMKAAVHFFLIRDPRRMAASYQDRMGKVSADALGLAQEVAIYDYVSGFQPVPAIVDASDILARPREMLALLCDRLGVDFSDAMLKWPAGRRDSDGIWASHWYHAVEQSTSFQAETPAFPVLSAAGEEAVKASQPLYEYLYAQRLR